MLYLCSLGLQAQQTPLSAMSNEQFLDYLRITRSGVAPAHGGTQTLQPSDRCGLSIAAEIVRRNPTLGVAQREELRSLLAPPPYQTSVISPSGLFEIHFDTSGAHMAGLLNPAGQVIPGTAFEYARDVATYFDSSYVFEVLQRGYLPPPFESGTQRYHVYVKNKYPNYGETLLQTQLSSGTARPCYTTFIEMDNDFREFKSKGLEGAKVTAAHEFHHMIQIGSYGFWDTDRFFYEMTAVYFEDEVYDSVNDYVYYLPTFFSHPERSLYQSDGYDIAIWLKMIHARHDPDVVRNFWERVRSDAPMKAMNDGLISRQSDLSVEFCAFAQWNYYTKTRWTGKKDEYEEGAVYPLVNIITTLNLAGTTGAMSGSVTPLAADYVRAYRGPDTVVFAIANVDVPAALNKGNSAAGYQLEVRTEGYGPDYTRIDSLGWGYKFIPEPGASLCVSSLLHNPAANITISSPFPNPFHSTTDQNLFFPIDRASTATRADLYVFSASMSLVRKMENIEIRPDSRFGRYVAWDGKDSQGREAATGVYIYYLQYGNVNRTGKIAVQNR